MRRITRIPIIRYQRLITMHFLAEGALEDDSVRYGRLLEAARSAGVDILKAAIPTTLFLAVKLSFAVYIPLLLVGL